MLGAEEVVGILLGFKELTLGVFVVGPVVLLLGGHNPAWIQTPVQEKGSTTVGANSAALHLDESSMQTNIASPTRT